MNSIDSLTDATAREMMISTARILNDRIRIDIDAIANDEFSDDDTDYIPARARILSILMNALADIDISPSDALRELISDDDFIIDIEGCDIALPLSYLID